MGRGRADRVANDTAPVAGTVPRRAASDRYVDSLEGPVRRLLPYVTPALLLGGCANAVPVAPAAAPVTWTPPAKYAFTLSSECGERALIGRFRVTVADGRVTGTEGLDQASRRALMLRIADLVPTLQKLEEEAATARRTGADVVRVDRDPADAHPVRISIDPSADAVDDEACYTIQDYTIGLAATPSAPPSR
ncbi:DUF6174 domain-containing protein [Couchioplanes caeruleus]|uniref:DUF6174 domain-containing protein n=1 Tax=Couchioplanes caeruleus TaxID=56438 RepID=UPI0020BE89AF|nr:DUF6174 domain-containing protein [Couchioplanes caeruleus]UQU64429.1 DUF6174 domain-containing protein [Couchioplanes caeruleus]